jgi:hypothetical protein
MYVRGDCMESVVDDPRSIMPLRDIIIYAKTVLAIL